ncbi:hypothetical protein [Metabacillus sediminilitoris]|uniref:Uncharacterized protein n=1 Tax=Metabacillus sediminilitoris TaxID=2567941 RepID=A0A4S4BW19_9BACI|nr:hypothetical protein [Metabacillus sediminilitoris]QGQ46187.1 hypothetical protein GMB29_13755 [Metabacillus sediminilitoris]THF79240.1 hypothetical protein E6W99_12865 [Metabacillus sediminilitoris]
MTNPNRVRNGGFEQSAPPALPPFWSGSGETESGGTQLLGDNNARLSPSENINQVLLPLQTGEQYQFQAAFFRIGPVSTITETIDVDITGILTRKFQIVNIQSDDYIFYNFDFIATGTTASLIITNNSNVDVRVDVVSVKRASPNRVQNGGFEQSIPPNLSPFWTGTGQTFTGDHEQLLGDNYAVLFANENISQVLQPLQVGETYTFEAAFSFNGPSVGAVEVSVTGTPLRSFQAANIITTAYAYYKFDFVATVATPTLTITNNSGVNLNIDVVSVKLA